MSCVIIDTCQSGSGGAVALASGPSPSSGLLLIPHADRHVFGGTGE